MVKLPILFQDPLFYPNQDIELIISNTISLEDVLCQHYFLYDIAVYLRMKDFYEPWKHSEQSIPLLLKSWEGKKEELKMIFGDRDRRMAKEPMIRSISYFICFLFWGNQLSVPYLKNINQAIVQLKCKPINIEERLAFIYSKPDYYQSFIQLSQLFEEFEKQYYKLLILKRTKI